MNTSFFGRLTRDPEVKTSQSGTQYTIISVATQLPIKETNGSGRKSLFISCTAFGKQGEAVAQYFRKGSRIVVDGIVNDINIGHGQNGGEYLNINVNLNNFHIVDTKAEAGQAPQGSYPAQPPTAPPPGYAQPPQQGNYPAQPPQQGYATPPSGQAPWSSPSAPPANYANAPY